MPIHTHIKGTRCVSRGWSDQGCCQAGDVAVRLEEVRDVLKSTTPAVSHPACGDAE